MVALSGGSGRNVIVPRHHLFGWLERRYSKHTLSRVVVVLFAALLTTQLFFVWYFGNVGVALGEMGYDSDGRLAIISHEDQAEFARDYDPTLEEGWCLYGSVSETHIYITDVVHATPLSVDTKHITFTCLRETVSQLLSGRDAHLIGTVHSHPSKNRSRPSRVDTMTWGRTSPIVKVMGIYTTGDGVEFFTVQSILTPLDKEVR